jgi:hypothetical protein
VGFDLSERQRERLPVAADGEVKAAIAASGPPGSERCPGHFLPSFPCRPEGLLVTFSGFLFPDIRDTRGEARAPRITIIR